MVPRPVERIHVVSRFFDDSPGLIDRVMRDLAPSQLFLYTQNGVTTMTAELAGSPVYSIWACRVLLCSYEDDGHQQPLHAKAMVFESGQTRTLVYGSANFTSPALLTHGKSGNIETVVVVPDIPAKTLDSLRFCDPSGSAYHLQSPDQLQSAPRDDEKYLPAMPVRLIEAVLADDKLMMLARIPVEIGIEMVAARLHVQGSRGQVLPITRLSDRAILGDRSRTDRVAAAGVVYPCQHRNVQRT